MITASRSEVKFHQTKERKNHCYQNAAPVVTIIPAGVEIGGCSVTAVIPKGFKTIESNAFEKFTRLTSLTLPDTLTNIYANAFDGCSSLTSLALPAVTGIRKHAFRSCSGLTSLTLSNTLRSVEKGAFEKCSGLTSLTLPDALTSVGEDAFKGCSGLTSLTLPGALTSLGDRTFSRCSGLTSLTLPDSLTSVGRSAFSNCYRLTALTLPQNLTNVGEYAFSECMGLKSVVFQPWVPSAFIAWAVGNSRNRTNWQLTTVERLRNVLRLITEFALEQCRDVTSVDPDGRNRVFAGCAGLSEVVDIPYGYSSDESDSVFRYGSDVSHDYDF